MTEETQLTPVAIEDMSAKQLQEMLGKLGFVSPELITSKDALKAVISNYQATAAAAQKAIEDADKKVAESIDNQVKKVLPNGKVEDPLAPGLEDRATEKTDAKLWEGKAKAMRLHLAEQPKVQFLIPLGFGEKRGAYETIILNGFRLNIMKGVMVEIPKQVATLLAESYQLTAEAGQEFLIDRTEAVKENLT